MPRLRPLASSILLVLLVSACGSGPSQTETPFEREPEDPGTGNQGPPSNPTLTEASREAASAAGGAAIVLKGTDFRQGATVLFGGVASTSVTVTADTLLVARTPARGVGLVDVTVRNPDGNSATLGSVIEFLPAPTRFHVAHDFEDGTVGAFDTFANNGANISVGNWGAGYSVSGTQSVRTRAVAGVAAGGSRLVHFYSPGQPALDQTGVYQRWYIRVDQTTIQKVRAGQIKLLLNRADTNPPSWLHMGFGGQFPGAQDHVSVLRDYDTGALPNGQTQTGFAIKADEWIEFQTWFRRSNGAGRARLWINGRPILDVTDPLFGGDNASKVMRWFLGIGYTQATSPGGSLTIYVDDAAAANGWIDPPGS